MTPSTRDLELLARCVQLAEEASQGGNLPIGSLIARGAEVVAEGRNAVVVPAAAPGRHAECEALRAVPAELWQDPAALTCYTTLEPCVMCMGTLVLHGVGRVVFGATDPAGGAGPTLAHLPAYYHGGRGTPSWEGPYLAEVCDPLYQRALATYQALPWAVEQG